MAEVAVEAVEVVAMGTVVVVMETEVVTEVLNIINLDFVNFSD